MSLLLVAGDSGRVLLDQLAENEELEHGEYDKRQSEIHDPEVARVREDADAKNIEARGTP